MPLSKNISFLAMKERIAYIWKPIRGFNIVDVRAAYFMAKFDLEEDKSKGNNGGPWMFNNHYLSVSLWTLNFNVSRARIERTMV